MHEPSLNILYHWIAEREKAREGKEAGLPKPWTDDPIIQQYRFCNVDRNNDKVTKYIYETITAPMAEHPLCGFNLTLARFINYPDTMEELELPWIEWDPVRFIAAMNKRQTRSDQLFNGAYMIRGGTGVDAHKPKHVYLEEKTFTPLYNRFIKDKPAFLTLQEWSDWFSQTFGMGDFMRNQVITDMRYGPFADKEKYSDWGTFVLPGPGTTRGLNRLHNRDVNTRVSKEHLIGELLVLNERLKQDYPELASTWADPNNASNCMCEFDKYCRVYYGEKGRPKAKYEGTAKVLTKKQREQLTKESLAKQREAAAKRPTIKCEYCGKEVKINMYARWHGKNCKNFKEAV